MRLKTGTTPIETLTERLKLLPRRLRVAHLRALIARQFPGSIRRHQLAGLLRDEIMLQAGERGGVR